jgi:uncharacterized membrane protein YbaN (DUF454 family)
MTDELSDNRDDGPQRLSPLSWPLRVALLGLGWLSVLIGIAGLFLPGIQGILTIAIGIALLSLGSESLHRFLHYRLRRWPRIWRPIESFRVRLHKWLSPKD